MYVESDASISLDVTDATYENTDLKSSQNDHTSTSIGPFIAGGIIGIFVLLGSMIVLVAIVLFMKRRYNDCVYTYSYNKTTWHACCLSENRGSH